MAASGLIGGTALLVLIAAYRSAPAALVAPFQYSQMVWAILIGFVVWGDVPGGRQAARRGGGGRERPVHPLPRDRARPPPDRVAAPQRGPAAHRRPARPGLTACDA